MWCTVEREHDESGMEIQSARGRREKKSEEKESEAERIRIRGGGKEVKREESKKTKRESRE